MRMFLIHLFSLGFLASASAVADEPIWALSADRRAVFLDLPIAPDRAELRIAGTNRGMALSIDRDAGGRVLLQSQWPLMPGAEYELLLDNGGEVQTLSVLAHRSAVPPARVSRVSPGLAVLPENLLRLHIHFDSPMARGQAAKFIQLLDTTGRPAPDAFLNLGIELWSPDQRRLTILFDPGRLKRGVGPNMALGPPMMRGERYVIEVLGGMKDARNRALGDVFRHAFTVGPAERRVIDPTDWAMTLKGDVLRIDPGRALDEQSALSEIQLYSGDGEMHPTKPELSGRILSWRVGNRPLDPDLRIVVGPLLEDAAGNTTCASFDTSIGKGTTCKQEILLSTPQMN